MGNIRIVTYQVNIGISEFGLPAFIALCEDVTKGVA